MLFRRSTDAGSSGSHNAMRNIAAGTEFKYSCHDIHWCNLTWRASRDSEKKCCLGNTHAHSVIYEEPSEEDACAWMEPVAKSELKEMQSRFEEDEDDAPLSEVIRGLTPKKAKGKSGGVYISVAGGSATKDTAEPIRNMTPMVSDGNSGPKGAENSGALKRSRTTLPARADNAEKLPSVVGRQKVPQDAKLVRGPPRLPAKPNALEEEEIKLARKKAKIDATGGQGSRPATVASSEQILSHSTPRVADFRRARDAVNKRLAEESANCFPVPEAACAEVEFAQDMEIAAVQDYRKVCEDLVPVVREKLKDGTKHVPADSVNKWVETRCKMLQRKVDLHFSIVRQMVGPIFSMSATLEEELP